MSTNLGAIHQDLVRNQGEITIQKIIESQLEVFSLQEDDRILLTGGEIGVQAEHGKMLGMAFHELLTTAMKYGALAGEGGTINVS